MHHGEGEMVYEDVPDLCDYTESYSGQWKNGDFVENAKGKRTSCSGVVYEGEMPYVQSHHSANGEAPGDVTEGVSTYPEGHPYREYIGRHIDFYPYCSDIDSSQPVPGKLTMANGEIHEGTFCYAGETRVYDAP